MQGRVSQGRGSVQNQDTASTNTTSLQWLVEEKIEAKLKFSQFLDEVTISVLGPDSLQAFGKPISPPPRRAILHCSYPWITITSTSATSTTQAQSEDKIQAVYQCSLSPSRSMAQQQNTLLDEQGPTVPLEKAYLETDIDNVRMEDEMKDAKIQVDTPPPTEIDERKVIPPPPEFCQDTVFRRRSPGPVFHWDSGFTRYPCRSVSLPRGINMVSDGTPLKD